MLFLLTVCRALDLLWCVAGTTGRRFPVWTERKRREESGVCGLGGGPMAPHSRIALIRTPSYRGAVALLPNGKEK